MLACLGVDVLACQGVAWMLACLGVGVPVPWRGCVGKPWGGLESQGVDVLESLGVDAGEPRRGCVGKPRRGAGWEAVAWTGLACLGMDRAGQPWSGLGSLGADVLAAATEPWLGPSAGNQMQKDRTNGTV
jgi:hypothetical protein